MDLLTIIAFVVVIWFGLSVIVALALAAVFRRIAAAEIARGHLVVYLQAKSADDTLTRELVQAAEATAATDADRRRARVGRAFVRHRSVRTRA